MLLWPCILRQHWTTESDGPRWRTARKEAGPKRFDSSQWNRKVKDFILLPTSFPLKPASVYMSTHTSLLRVFEGTTPTQSVLWRSFNLVQVQVLSGLSTHIEVAAPSPPLSVFKIRLLCGILFELQSSDPFDGPFTFSFRFFFNLGGWQNPWMFGDLESVGILWTYLIVSTCEKIHWKPADDI